MRRFAELFLWISVIALMVLFLAGLFFSFLVREPGPRIEPTEWKEKK
jgi:Ni,Fe-hydrogenase I cytochrome b subunit